MMNETEDESAVDPIILINNLSIDDANNGGTGKRRKSKSRVWEDFIPVSSGGKIQNAICKHCGKRLSGRSSGGTSHLGRHLKICPGRPGKSMEGQKNSSSQTNPSILENWEFDQEKSVEDLTSLIISNLCPFSIVKSTSFMQFVARINPTFNMVSQATIEEKVIAIFHKEKLKLKEKVRNAPGGVLLSVGTWGLVFSPTFRCFTVHFIDENWKVNRRIISYRCAGTELDDDYYYVSMFPDWQSFCSLGDSHKTKLQVAQDWGIQQNLLGVTSQVPVDNEFISGIEAGLSGSKYLLSKFKLLTVPCLVNALDRIFGFEIKEIIEETSRSYFCYMTCSSVCKHKYNEIISSMHLKHPSFGSKQWYLTFYLLEVILKFCKAFPDIDITDPLHYRKPTSEQLEAAEAFCKIGRPIYHATKVICSPHNASNAYFDPLLRLRIVLQESSSKPNIKRVLDVEDMNRDFEKHWDKWYLWLSVAVVLDPRHKIRFVELRFRQAFGTSAKMYISEVRGKICELFTSYSFHTRQKSILTRTNNELPQQVSDSYSLRDTNQSYNELSGQGKFKELNDYLGGELHLQNHGEYFGETFAPANDAAFHGERVCRQNDDFDILKWWKDNESTYPTLAAIARDVLAIPGSAVPSEAAFDVADERARLFETELSPQTAEALICTQSWIS